MYEIVLNLHMHTRYSDGHLSHAQIASAAIRAGIEAVIVTDHNVWVNGPENYYKEGNRRALVMVGEEIHDQAREPQKNHMLVFGARRELATYAYDPQRLIDAVNQAGGLAFIAHPVDPAAPTVGEGDISWVAWDVQGFHGIELWNGFSEFKSRIKSKLHAIYYAYNFPLIARGPEPEALRRWDEILAGGKKAVAVGGSDAHALPARLGPLRRTLFPFEQHFRAVNTHVYLPRPLGSEAAEDSNIILDALRMGHCFVGYDLPASTRGFRFTAQGMGQSAQMGDEMPLMGGVTLQAKLPLRTNFNLLRNGKPLKTWHNRDICTYTATEPGAYRIEAYIYYRGRQRGWIYSNPIYIK